jgi:hypothetical protein
MLTFILFVFCLLLLVLVSLATRHSEYEEPLASPPAAGEPAARDSAAGALVWRFWAGLAVVMVCLYVGFQSLSLRRQQAELYVSVGLADEKGHIKIPAGSDSNPGTARHPFRTLERARAEVQKRAAAGTLPEGGLKVWLHGGVYPGDKPLVLGLQDSGQPGRPVVWRAFPGERPLAACEVPVAVAPDLGAERASQQD